MTNTRSGFLRTTKRYAAADDAIHFGDKRCVAFLILGAFWFTNGTVDSEFLVNLLST